MLALVILLMAASTLAIGLLPTYAAIGDVAPYVAPNVLHRRRSRKA